MHLWSPLIPQSAPHRAAERRKASYTTFDPMHSHLFSQESPQFQFHKSFSISLLVCLRASSKVAWSIGSPTASLIPIFIRTCPPKHLQLLQVILFYMPLVLASPERCGSLEWVECKISLFCQTWSLQRGVSARFATCSTGTAHDYVGFSVLEFANAAGSNFFLQGPVFSAFFVFWDLPHIIPRHSFPRPKWIG